MEFAFIRVNFIMLMGVPVKENVKTRQDSAVGIGSVVSKDIPDNVIALGNPARSTKHKNDKKYFKEERKC